ncbi:MAG TPA: hypothetical protein H9830_02865 [Candidatus Agrococcus pullicola]|uniref:Uncharacterized protein n=1 Tax=Candidatus Agrococcus pullicola TaxID=2838429 RepID=A0A9D1YU66_9MICO|nr:hypothetical protein [Candidatus Agrococcus pullicola]
MSDEVDSTLHQPAPRPATRSASPAGSNRVWLLAGILGIVGGYVLWSSLPQLGTRFISGGVFLNEGLLYMTQILLGLACVVVAMLNAPGSLPRRLIAVVIVIVIAALAFFLFLMRLQSGLGPVFRGPVGGLLTSLEGWLVLSGAAGWLLAAGARPLAWLSLVGVLLVAPLRLLLQWQGFDVAITTVVLQALMLIAALAVLLASKPRPIRPPSSPQSPYAGMPTHRAHP